uniref:Terpene synthase 4 n=1 Tax=Prunella vulgaris TaxID=39358 RepID=A0A6B7LN08_PRUVU|nr:terpene synthase 4 [Prunella vulgaris]
MGEESSVSCLRNSRPPVTDYVPSIWADTFSTSSFKEQEQQKYEEAIEELKKEARCILLTAAASPRKQMILIDTLERLGLAYHFETEIEHILQQINQQTLQDYDLFTTTLGFRLLRQHRHHVSCSVFDKFLDQDAKFKESLLLSSDTESVLSLYDAAHVRFRHENLLKEAAVSTKQYLRGIEAELLDSSLKEKVNRALKHPLHRDVPIFYARFFISIYEKDLSGNELLLKLAKLNFNFLQNLYKEELFQLTVWWNKFDLKSKLTYARDRLVEAYLWGVAYHYEPQYYNVRIGLVKGIQITGIMDDTYDNYATLNEAQIFTQTLDRWNANEVDGLPDYMKIVYDFILSIYEDYKCSASKHEKGFSVPYFKEAVQELSSAYNQELEWVTERNMPSFIEYARNSEITSSLYMMFAGIIPGLKSLTPETIDWVKNEPLITVSTAMIGRYMDDIGSQHRESKGGKVLTAVDCYMKQYNVSKEETLSKFGELVEDAWEDLNKEWVETTSFLPTEIAVQFLNYARMCDACYNSNDGDGYTDPAIFKSNVVALFLNPLLI